MKKEIKIGGMHCSHCVRHIEEALEDMRVRNIKVSLDTESAIIEFDNNIDDKDIINAIEDVGYEVRSIREVY